jgi:Uma2 family endonuclease
MSTPALNRLVSVEEYLRMERASPVKHEYVGGELYAMVGASKRHNRIAFNIAQKLDGAAVGGRCRVYLSDVKLRATERVFYYPDVMVACGPEGGDPYVEDAPCLIVEVASPSTEATNRREKLYVYQQIPALRCYLIVQQDQRRVDRFWLDPANGWCHAIHTPENGALHVPVPCPEASISLDEIYARLEPASAST